MTRRRDSIKQALYRAGDSGMDAALGFFLSVLSLAAFVTFLCCAVMAVGRLSKIRDSLTKIENHLFVIRHPEIPFPALPPETVVHREYRDGSLHGLRADGRWQRWSLRTADWEPV